MSIAVRAETPWVVNRDEATAPASTAVGQGTKGRICMIAYTDYAIDARVRREAETLASHGFHVVCLTTRSGAEQKKFILEGVEVQELPVPKYRGKSTISYIGSYLRFLLASSAECLRLLRTRQLDAVHVHNLPDFLVLAGLLPRLAGKKVVLDIHDSVPETFAAKFARRRVVVHKALCLEERLSALVAHRIICVNHPQRDVLVSRGMTGVKTFISMNVPDPKIFPHRSTHVRSHVERHAFDLVYHGTMAQRLGVDLVIRAVERLRGRIPGLRLHLWGDGDDAGAFQKLAHDMGLNGSVRFNRHGFPLQELPAHLNRMDVGVVGNRRSAACDLMLPVKLMEYVALGIPAVVPRLKTIQYYFSEQMAGYYEPEDVGSMADAIYRLYSEPQLAARQAALAATFLETYGWQRQGVELVNFYQQLLEN